MKAVQQKNYTLVEIQKLSLRDAPFLMVYTNDDWFPIQTSHIIEEEMGDLPEWAETMWTYIYETHEWIPIFKAVNSEEVIKLLNIVATPDDFGDEVMLSPKAFPLDD